MNIVIGCTRAGLKLKEHLIKFLIEKGNTVEDVGMKADGEFVPYHKAAANVASAVSEGKFERGIVICGTGAGSVIVANKFNGVYAVHCSNQFEAQKAAAVNGANVIVFGEWITPGEHATEILKTWMGANFGEGFTPEWTQFLQGALNEIKTMEKDNFK
jgi:ribose 5-phosphate isomerase B